MITDYREFDKAINIMQATPKAVQAAIGSALSRSLTAGRATISKSTREKYVIKAANIKKAIRTQRMAEGEAQLLVEGSPLDLMEFKVGITRRGVKANVKRGGGKFLPHSFFVDRNVKKAGIFSREGVSRLPIQRHFGPSLPQMIGAVGVKENVLQRMEDVFEERFAHEIERRLSKGEMK